MPPRGRRPDGASGGRSTPQQRRQDPRRSNARGRLDQEGPIPPLALAAASVDGDVSRNRISPTTRATFQAVALLVRELREKTKTDPMNEARRAQELKRIEGLATALARTAAKQPTLLTLLTDDAGRLPGTATILTELRAKTGLEAPDEPEPLVVDPATTREQRSVIPDSVRARVLANPFLAPDYSAAPPPRPKPRLLVGWELLQPLLRAFEESSEGAPSCMALPDPTHTHIAWGRELMPHQAQVVAAAREGHRTFLLADEPGLGKTAQALLAAQAANAYPLLVVVPNVVKTSWAREAAMWTPRHPATVVHSDGDDVDAFSDIVVVNYDILDRHVGWLSRFGFRGMVVDEAHDIPARRIADMPVELDGAAASSVLEAERRLVRRLVKRYESALAARKDADQVVGIDHGLVRQICARDLREASDDDSGENVFSMMRQIGQAKAELAADYTVQLSRNAGKVVFFAKHIDVMDTAEQLLARRGVGYTSIRGDQTARARQRSVDAFVNDPDVHVAVCSLLAAGVGINLQVSSNVVLAELSWTAAEQTQAIDRVHRIGQDQPVTAWRIIAAQTIDARVAELVDAKAGLAARALDGSDEEIASSVDVQLEALVTLLTDALSALPTG